MLKLIGFSIAVVYVFACFGTMPKQCFTPRFAVKCQQIQFEAIKDWRAINWASIQSIRVTAR